MAKRDVDIQHEIDGSVWRCTFTDAKLKAPTSGIIVFIDFSLPEEYTEAVFNIANDLKPMLDEAAARLWTEVRNNPKGLVQKHHG